MAADNFVVVRRTISQTLVPYKEVQEKLLLRRSRETGLSERRHFGSTNTVARCGETQWRDSAKRVTFDERSQSILERSRSEVCLRRKSSYVRETSLDVYEEGREQGHGGLVKPILRRREREGNAPRRSNSSAKATRPKSDFFAEFEVKFKNGGTRKRCETDADERLGRCIDVLRKEMLSLRQQDNELLKQLTTLSEHIKDLKQLSRVHGGLFESTYANDGDVGEQLNTSSPVAKMRNISQTTPTRTDPLRREKCGNGEGHVRNQPVNWDNGGVEAGDGIRRFQETSFEYNEEPLLRVAAQPRSLPAKSPKQPQPAGKPTVNVTRQSSLRLERKSVSCQFLDSRGTDTRSKRYSEHPESFVKRVNSMTISENCDENSRNANKQKSLSMCQLQRTTKATEVSTSDSECSTSGCYGGSSTGSEFESERRVTRVESSTDEEREKYETDKANALKSGKNKQGYHPPRSTQPEPFRKQIVSV